MVLLYIKDRPFLHSIHNQTMTTDDPAQLLTFLWLCYSAVFRKVGGETTARRRSRKISVPAGYKFRPTDEDLVNHHLKPKQMNNPEDYCLIPEHNHYEAEPWDLITKYNELSDRESDDDECFFFSTNRSGKRTGRSTPKGYWHETSTKKRIEGTDGVTYVMRYFTFYIGRRQKDGKSTPWRMREFTDPSNKELALCKIFKDVEEKKNDVRDSVIAVVSSATMISPVYQNHADSSQEASLDTVVESSRIPTPLADANLTSNTSVSLPQLQPTQFEESQVPAPSSDLNSMNGGVISPHQQQTHNEEGFLPVLNAFADQFLDLDDPPQHDQLVHSKNTVNDGYNNEHYNLLCPPSVTSNVVVPASKRRHRHRDEGTSLEASQQPPMKKSRTLINHSQDLDLQPSNCGYYPHQTHIDNMLIGNGSEEVTEEASLANPPTEPVNFASSNSTASSQYQFQMPVEVSCKDGYVEGPQPWSVPDNHNILYLSESRHTQETDMEKLLADLQAVSSPSNYICLDDIPSPPLPPRMEVSPTNSTNTEGHSDESTVSLSPSDRTYDKVNTSKPSGVEIHEAPQTIQQVLSQLYFPLQSPTHWSPCSSIAPLQTDMQYISEEMSNPDIDNNYQGLWD